MPGRPKGSKDKAPRRTAARKQAEAAAAEGIMPLDLMLRVMRQRWEAQDWDGALAAAEKAAPYVHPKLAATDLTSKGERVGYVIAAPAEIESADEWEARHQPRH